MPILVLSTLVSIIAIVHVLKTGRNHLWLMVLFALPVAGALAYFVVEILPELRQGRRGQKVSRSVADALNPTRTLDEAKRQYEISDTVESACNLADIHLQKEQYDAAAKLFRSTLQGLNENNPDILHKLARCEFGLGNYARCRELLDLLIDKNPDYKNQDAHLLYARTLQALGDITAATDEYETLIKYYTGPEPAYQFALMLKSSGNPARARQLCSDIVKKAELSPAHYRKMHSHWIDLAGREL